MSGLGRYLGALIAVLLVAGDPGLLAQADPFERYSHRVYDQDKGLPETLINALARTPDGYLWLGTRRGLVRTDGVRFELISTDQVPALSADLVNALATDGRGRLWIGTRNGLAVQDRGRFQAVSVASGLPKAEVTRLFIDRDDRVWIAAAHGVFLGVGGRFSRLADSGLGATGFAETKDGRVWVATDAGLLEHRGGRLVPVPIPGVAGKLGAIVVDQSGSLWLGLRGGVKRLTIDSTGGLRGSTVVAVSRGGTEPLITTLGHDLLGRLWIGSVTHGLAVWDGARLTWFGLDRGLSSLEVTGFLIDSRSRVWIGTGAGLDLFQPSPFTTYSADDGFPHSLVWTVQGTADDQVIAAAENGGIYRFDGSRLQIVVPPTAPDAGQTPFAITPLGRLVVATRDDRVLELGSGGPTDLTARLGLPRSAGIDGLFATRDGSLWFASDSGLFRSRAGQLESINRTLGLPIEPRLRIVAEDSTGAIWLGRPNVRRFDRGRATLYGAAHGLTDSLVLALFPRGRDLWIGTADSGLFLLRNERVTSFGRLDKRLRSEVLGIAEDEFGYLWITSSYGLLRVRRAKLEAVADGREREITVRQFDRLDGLVSTEFNGNYQPSIFRDSQGRLWLPSYLGVVRVDPRLVVADSEPPQIHIERLLVEGRPYPIDAVSRFPPGVGRVAIEFAATDALVPSRVRFQYRLEGLDRDWVESRHGRVALFGPLDGGSYRFEVRAANEDGRWSEHTASVGFVVGLHWYEHRWFVVTLGLVALGLGFGIYWWRMRQVRNRSEELARLVEERTRDLEAARDSLERRVEERTSQLAEELAERKRLQHQLLQSQKLESIGRLAGGVAHEINNMMTGVLGFAEMAELQAQGQPAILDDLRQITNASHRVAQITQQLLTFARRQASKRSSIDLRDLFTSLDRFLLRIVGENVELSVAVADAAPRINADASQVEQLIVNLVMNAKDAIPGNGAIAIEVGGTTLTEMRQIGSFELLPGDYAVIAVVDSGVGMGADVRNRLFEPFFTTKEVNRGTGLGLSVCYGIVTQHAGAIAVESEVGRGSRFSVYLPTGLVSEEQPVVPTDSAVAGGVECVLVVEDEPAVRQVATRTLQHLGYEVVEAVDGVDALEKWAADRTRFDLVLTDVVMPRMSGVDLARALRNQRADLPLVFMSGYTGKDSQWTGGAAAIGPMLEKPFTRAALAAAIRTEIDRRSRPIHRGGVS
jgi:signal transduction histidine kinase/CheY-like chemotaxis protein/streptogramin lyase